MGRQPRALLSIFKGVVGEAPTAGAIRKWVCPPSAAEILVAIFPRRVRHVADPPRLVRNAERKMRRESADKAGGKYRHTTQWRNGERCGACGRRTRSDAVRSHDGDGERASYVCGYRHVGRRGRASY